MTARSITFCNSRIFPGHEYLTSAVIVSDVDKVIAQMAENGAIPKGTTLSSDLYLLPKELGGLSR